VQGKEKQMASVVLTRGEARSGRLPPLCIVCGEPTSFVKTKIMTWHPRALYFLVLLGIPGIILACGGTVVLLLAWVIATVIVSLTTVRAQDINQDEMFLAGVSPEFADALSDLPFDDDEDYPRGQRQRRRLRRPRQEDEYAEEGRDDDRPGRRRPPADAFKERD
jgi:hypothetical protein